MRVPILIAVSMICSTPLCADEDTGKHDDAAMLNYSIGYRVGSDFRIQEFELRPEFILKGIEDAIRREQPLLTAGERNKAMAVLGERVVEFKQKQRENATQGSDLNQEFLQRNAAKEGVKTTASGLQYKVITAGSGNPPGPADSVLVHYRGTLVDGHEFDSSYKRNSPASFRVNQVIKGWTEALQMMSPGAKWKLFIPAELGYGARGAGANIPPNSTLIFDVELLEIR